MSIFFIFIIAAMTRCALTGSGSLNNLTRTLGTICQDTPNLSCNQPHGSSLPPAESLSHKSSTSCCDSQFTTNEMDGVNLYCGPPLSATNSCPSSRKLAVMTVPLGPGPASP